MADEQAQKRTGNQQADKDSENVSGRIHNSQNPAFEQGDARNDISSVDQQEGNMNHGETGGNLAAGKEEK